jgi:ribosomal protein L11 methylase PrmA
MLFAAKLTPQDRVVDLGSGDGRLVFHAIKAGAKEATGYEIHAGLVWKAKLEAHLRHMPNAHFVHASFWDISLREVDLVFVYQLPSAMVKLAEKFAEELPEGARIVSNAFTIPNWKPVAEHGKVRLYVKGISNPSS